MSDTLKTLNCPACEKDMKKIYISDLGINIDFCENCGGLLFDNRELEKLQANSDVLSDILKTIYENDQKFEETDSDEVRECPVCGVPMVKIGTEIDDIQVDVCNACGAKYLDKGEFQKILESLDNVDKNKFDKFDQMVDDEAKKYNKEISWHKFYTPKRRDFFVNIISKIRGL